MRQRPAALHLCSMHDDVSARVPYCHGPSTGSEWQRGQRRTGQRELSLFLAGPGTGGRPSPGKKLSVGCWTPFCCWRPEAELRVAPTVLQMAPSRFQNSLKSVKCDTGSKGYPVEVECELVSRSASFCPLELE
jgi:hypothetical protein